MQLDIFEHSRDVILRNTVIDALRAYDCSSLVCAIKILAAEYGGDPLLPAFRELYERLSLPVAPPLVRALAADILRSTENIVVAAEEVFGDGAGVWLAPLWTELAETIAHLSFDPTCETLHAAPLLLRARNWIGASASIETIPSWRRQPTPLLWKVEAEYRISGLDAAWPMLAELSWMDPERASTLTARLQNPELTKLQRDFDAEFEVEGGPEDFAWFPAWTLIAEPRWTAAMRLAQPGASTPPERCAWQILELLLLERQGRHSELVEGRRKLRAMQPLLFDLYMRSR